MEIKCSSAYDQPTEKCPYCGEDCECDWVDVGVGNVQCGPYHCDNCGSSQIGPEMKYKLDQKTGLYVVENSEEFTEKEIEIGWYEPEKRQVSPYANTIGGILVDHEMAKEAYRIGILDEKQIGE